MPHPKADADKLYLPRIPRGRGLTQTETANKTTTVALETYLKHSEILRSSQYDNMKKGSS